METVLIAMTISKETKMKIMVTHLKKVVDPTFKILRSKSTKMMMRT